MRRLAILSIFTLAVAAPLYAAKGQSYFTYDDGGTIIRQGDDGREVDARVNVPVFPSDEVITSRRGRSEIRLSDGNVIALDRSTDIRFKSILDSYDGEGSQTIVELKYGHVIVQRTDSGREFLRLDTDSASYLAPDEAVYAVDSDRGTDRVVVFDGAVEVRTPNRTQRVRAGEEAITHGIHDVDEIEKLMRRFVTAEVDYLVVVDPETFERPRDFHRELLLAGAIRIGRTRLIDNVRLGRRS